jgi:hypothetical protein
MTEQKTLGENESHVVNRLYARAGRPVPTTRDFYGFLTQTAGVLTRV